MLKKHIFLVASIIPVMFLSACVPQKGSLQNVETSYVTGSLPETQAITIEDIPTTDETTEFTSIGDIPDYSGDAYIVINDNVPFFSKTELVVESFESYSDLDFLGRCGVAYACVGADIMPTEERGPIGQVKPTGWVTSKYDFVDGKYLYNRCHLIGYQLTGENANEKNLITGTRYMNVVGMLPFENDIAEYVRGTSNHVLYRVTPVFKDDNLLAEGVLMEAASVEDNGVGLSFNVFCYNVQPGVTIDYATGQNWDSGTVAETSVSQSECLYVLNVNSMKIHRSDCESVPEMKHSNKREVNTPYDELIEMGYSPCGRCHPES